MNILNLILKLIIETFISEYGCLISHLLCYKYFIENIKEDICLILEDDINFNYSKYYYTYFSEYIRDIPDDFDIIQLSVILRNSEYNDFINPCLYQNKYYFSTGAYLIKKSALKILNSIPCNDNIWDFSKLKLLPLADHYIYNLVDNVYSIPLISLNIPTKNDMTIIKKKWKVRLNFRPKVIMFYVIIGKINLSQMRKYMIKFPKVFFINRDQDTIEENLWNFNLIN